MKTAMKTEVKERPILFSTPMVRKILSGEKTQTRRIIKPQPIKVIDWRIMDMGLTPYKLAKPPKEMPQAIVKEIMQCPYGKPGDRLWVRETWNQAYKKDLDTREKIYHYIYKADYFDRPLDGVVIHGKTDKSEFKTMADLHVWKSPRFMPRDASRITLEITDVRVERLQDISEKDALAEGCTCTFLQPGLAADEMECATEEFARLWDSINGKKHSWEDNPWVWAITFKRLD